ncbi:MAG: DUF1565 domain-containing protein, partial [Muribaculaceae bacterium]|nr:DUF1565 domain-containing protein [Muribaculaceae bacterium]
MMLRKLLLVTAVLAMTASAATHRLATFNIRVYAADDNEGKNWSRRGPKCSDVIKKYDFDIIGFQEVNGTGKGYYNPKTGRTPMADMKAWLPEYSFELWDRDGNKNGEYIGVAYKTSRYELLDKGSFYITPTPDVLSQGWDPAIKSYHRRLGWTKLKDKATGEMMIYAATHTNDGWMLDGPYGSQLIAERLKTIANGLPVMVVADYNTSRTAAHAQKGLKAYHASFFDAALETPADKNYSVPTSNPAVTWTYNAYHPASDKSYTGSEIDYHFYRGMNVLERHIVTDEFTYNGAQYPVSDHFPVYVVAELAPVQPKSYYVDCNAADGGNGTKAAPYRTISQAVARTTIDDVIYVAAGTYNESVQPTRTISILGGYSGDFSRVTGTSVLSGEGLQYPPIYAPKYI